MAVKDLRHEINDTRNWDQRKRDTERERVVRDFKSCFFCRQGLEINGFVNAGVLTIKIVFLREDATILMNMSQIKIAFDAFLFEQQHMAKKHQTLKIWGQTQTRY